MAILTVFVMITSFIWAQSENHAPVLRSRIYKLRKLQTESAKKILGDLKIGHDFTMLQHNAMIVTSYEPASCGAMAPPTPPQPGLKALLL